MPTANVGISLGIAIIVESQTTLKQGNQDLVAEVRSAQERTRQEIQVQQHSLNEAIKQRRDHAMEALQNRLEEFIQSSLRDIMTKFRKQSEEYLETLARSTEQRLHQVYNQIFAEIAERLREGLLELRLSRNDDATSASAGR